MIVAVYDAKPSTSPGTAPASSEQNRHPGCPPLTRLIAAAPFAPIRRNVEKMSLSGYLLGSAIFVAAVIGLFTVAGFHL